MKNPTVLVLSGIFIEEGLSDDELFEVQEKLSEVVIESLKKTCSEIPHVEVFEGQSYVHLDPNEENCFKCENCGAWATNYEEPNEIYGLQSGREFEGMLICKECEIWKHDQEYGWSKKK